MSLKQHQTFWMENGKLFNNGYAIDSKQRAQGIVIFYNIQGVKSRKAMYKDGSVHGETIQYDENGNITSDHTVYIKGKHSSEFVGYYKDLTQADKDKLSNEHGVVWFDDIEPFLN